MRNLCLWLSLVFVISGGANKAQAKPIHLVSSSQSDRGLASLSQKLDSYVFAASLNGYYELPSGTDCSQAFKEYLSSLNYLEVKAEAGHVDYVFVQTEDCIQRADGTVLIPLEANISALDQYGNEFLTKYAAKVAQNKFFHYQVEPRKVNHVVYHFEIQGYGDFGSSELLSYLDPNDRSTILSELAQLELTFNQSTNKQLVLEYLLKKTSKQKVDEFENGLISKAQTIMFSGYPIYIFSDRTLSRWYYRDGFRYDCPSIGTCLR